MSIAFQWLIWNSRLGRRVLARAARAAVVWLVLAVVLPVWRAGAQPAQIFYDLAGNQVTLSGGVAVPPVLVSPPQPQLLESNAPVTFSVVATGSGLSYQWLSNGVPIPGATLDSLMVGNASAGGLGSYTVLVSNPYGSVTSAPAAIWPDSNGSGMPDWWQLMYFGNLNQPPTSDFDGDGVSNLDEYLEGTNPTNAASFNPRLILNETPLGSIVPAPDLPYYALGQVVTLAAVPATGQEFLGWAGDVAGLKPVVSLLMNGPKVVSGSFGLPLSVALDNTNLVWTTGGDAPWYGQTEVSEDGLGSAQSGLITYSQESWLKAEIQINQAGRLSFWWNVSSQAPDQLAFSKDGVVVATISGEEESWRQMRTNLVSGSHTLLWTYAKGVYDVPTGIPFADAGWVEEVTLSIQSEAVPPLFSLVTLTGAEVILNWTAAAGLTYQLQYKTNLDQSGWINLGGIITATSATGSASDPNPPDPQRFYRVELLP